MGRVKFNLEVQTKLCAMVTVGASVRNAARLNDVRESTVRKAAKRDPDFAARLNRALAQRELLPLKNLQAAGAKYWRASAWLLERIDRQAYGRYQPDLFTDERAADLFEVFAEIASRYVRKEDGPAFFRDIDDIANKLRSQGRIGWPRDRSLKFNERSEDRMQPEASP